MRGRAGPLLPDWYPGQHPFYLSPSARNEVRREFDRSSIFLNIPYATRYSNLEVAILSTVTAYDLVPRMAKQALGLDVRIQKIVRLMLSCAYGLTDLTYARRMNMPFELGMLLCWARPTFVVSSSLARHVRALSDLNFGDIRYHGGRVRTLIHELAGWIEQNCTTRRLSEISLLRRYRQWQFIRKQLGPDFDRRTPQEITRLIDVVEPDYSIRFADSPRRRRTGRGRVQNAR